MALGSTLVAALAGCTNIHLMEASDAPPAAAAFGATATAPLGSTAIAAPPAGDVTGSIAPSSLGYAGSDLSDWDSIRSTVTTSLSAPPSAHIEWSNSTTGSSGTISELTTVAPSAGRECRSFATTIAAVDGVRLYHAELCQGPLKNWQYSKIAAADAR